MKQILFIVIAIVLLGLVGRMDYDTEVMTHKQDELNKQEFIKEMQIRCLNGDVSISQEYCRGI